jgi:hypothetical protein
MGDSASFGSTVEEVMLAFKPERGCGQSELDDAIDKHFSSVYTHSPLNNSGKHCIRYGYSFKN